MPDCLDPKLTEGAGLQGVSTEEVLKVLRSRFGTSGIDEKAARPPKAVQ